MYPIKKEKTIKYVNASDQVRKAKLVGLWISLCSRFQSLISTFMH